MIEAGDGVKHFPTGESWFILGVNQKRDQVCAAGWPPSIGKLSECVLEEKGTGITGKEREYRDERFGSGWDRD